MVELLIRHHESAADTSSATAALQSVFGNAIGITHGSPGTRFRLVIDALIDDSVSFSRITLTGSDLTITAADLADLVVLAPREGDLALRRGIDSLVIGPGRLGVLPMGQPVELTCDDAQFDAYSFPRTALSRLLGADIDPEGLNVSRLTPHSEAIASLWRHLAVSLVGDVLGNRELYESDMIRDQAVQALLGVTIEAFAISDTSEDDLSDMGIVARSEEYMLLHIGDPISVAHIARAAGVSIRGLQLAYRKTGLGTPIAHLRALRMKAAHLRLNHPNARRVNMIARELGYTNLGRFSAHYKEAHGVQPIDTLRAKTAASAEPTL